MRTLVAHAAVASHESVAAIFCGFPVIDRPALGTPALRRVFDPELFVYFSPPHRLPAVSGCDVSFRVCLPILLHVDPGLVFRSATVKEAVRLAAEGCRLAIHLS